jgi:hypothetical protein
MVGVLSCTRGSRRRNAIYDVVVRIIEVAATAVMLTMDRTIRNQTINTIVYCVPELK